MKDINKRCTAAAQKVWSSKYYLPALLAVCLTAQVTHTQLIAMGIMVLTCILLFIFCDDLMSIAAPVLLAIVLSVEFYKDYSALSVYALYVSVPFIIALVYNLIRYRRPLVKGRFTYPLVAVSCALILGGVGVISVEEYLRPISLYYVLCLGLAMFCLYMIFVSRLENERDYDRTERMADILFVTGLAAAAAVIMFYIENFDSFIEKGSVLFYKPRNFICSVLLMTLPSGCLLIRRNRIHIIGFLAMSIALIFAGSRSGLLFGAMVGFASVVYLVILFKDRIDLRKWYQWAVIALAMVLFLLAVKYIPVLYTSRMVNGSFISSEETRVSFIDLGIRDFLDNFLFGVGVGNFKNVEIFKAIIPGSIVFYHNEVIQVIASMGIVGAAAYGWVLYERLRLVIKTRRTPMVVFSIAYFGILAMSMTNPGLFCPFPEAGLTVLLFALMEKENELKT